MASFAPVKGTRTEINATPIVEGQFLLETDQGNMSKIYLDVDNNTRIIIGGGGTNYLWGLLDVDIDNRVGGDVLRYDTTNPSSPHWICGDFLDGWLKDTNNVIEEPVILAGNDTANFTNLKSACAYDVFVDVADGAERPRLKSVVIDEANLTAIVKFDTITNEQAGTSGNECRVRLRELK